MKYLGPALRKKSPELLEVTPLIFNDNAHAKGREDKQGEAIYPIRMTSFLTSYEWDELPHLAYSPCLFA